VKIYGQNFFSIFLKLPWPYKIVVVAGSAFIALTLVYVPYQIFQIRLEKVQTAEPLKISALAAPPLGVFDPALAYDPSANKVWLAYGAQEPSVKNDVLMHVRLAFSSADGGCRSFTQAAGGFEGKPDDILAPDGQTVFRSGEWRAETPAIVYDPDDKGREWKLYAYKYFWAKNDPVYALQVAQHYGMIVYKYSADPAQGWSTEQWLFSPAADYPPPPYDQMVLLKLNQLDPSLANISTYARPSVLYKDGALVMTLSAFTDGTTPDRVVMIVSRDHGNSWKYAGAPLTAADIRKMGGFTKLSGAALIEEKGQVYLAAVLGDEARRGQGAFIFGFEDFNKGVLRRDPQTGLPSLLRRLPLNNKNSGSIGGGFAAYAGACSFGLLTGEESDGGTGFQIFKTYKLPVEKK
jgi:hypothetical protein